MKQTLHIFRKDVRHQRTDLTVYAGLLVVFAVVTPRVWIGGDTDSSLSIFQALLKVVIPIVWVMIIGRLVQDESLVGDEQFWVTRPYRWGCLLGAKALFLVACVVAPFVAMQCWLLWVAGLHPLAAWSGLVGVLGSYALILWLPFMVVATITSTVPRMFTALGALVVVGAGMLTFLLGAGGPRMTPPFVAVALSALFGAAVLGIVVYQYAARNAVRACWSLGGTTVLFFTLMWLFATMHWPSPVNVLIREQYPVAPQGTERLVFDTSPAGYRNAVKQAVARGPFVGLMLPLYVEGLGSEMRLQKVAAGLIIDAPGYHYVAPFRPVDLSDQHGSRLLSLILPGDVYRRVHSREVRVHLTIVAQRLLPEPARVMTAEAQFPVPDDGVCLVTPLGRMACRYAYRGPEPTRVSARVSPQGCGPGAALQPGTNVLRTLEAGATPDPVVEEDLRMGGTVCLGTPLTFIRYRRAENFRMEMDLPALSLDYYTEY